MKIRSLLVGVLAVASGACGHGSSGAAGGGLLDACTLIGPQRAAAVLGGTVTVKHVGPTPTKPDDASECFYSAGHPGSGFLLIVARMGFDDAQAEARSQMAVARREKSPPGMPSIRIQAADGPGQAAYLGTTPAFTQLHVLDHGVSLVVNINQAPTPAVRARARKLAQAALDGLGHE